MSRSAAGTSRSPAEQLDDADPDLEAALDLALGATCQAIPDTAVVATTVDGGVRLAHHVGRVDPDTVSAIAERLAMEPDGLVGSIDSGGTAGWTGFRFGLGANDAVGVAVERTTLDELAGARLEAIASGLARRVLHAQERRRAGQLEQLLTTARRVAESLDLETVLTSIVGDATALLGAVSGDMLLWDRARNTLRVVAVSNFPPEMIGFELQFGDGVSSRAILAQETIEIADYRAYEHRARALDRYEFGAVLCAPLIFRGQGIGALNVHAGPGRDGFRQGAADLLAAFAGHAAIAIDHARRYENEVRLGRDLSETNRELTRSLTVQRQLAEQVLLDAGAPGIATVLAKHLGRRVAIQDHLHRLIAGAAPDGGDDWRALLPGPRDSLSSPGPARDPFAIAVRVGRDVVGHLLLSSDDDLGPIDRALVDIATTGVALEFAKERAAIEVEERLRGEALTDLLTGTYPDEEAIAARAARLGYDLSEPRDLVVIDVGTARHAAAPDPIADHDRLTRMLQHVHEWLAGQGSRGLAVVNAGYIVMLTARGRVGSRPVHDIVADLGAALSASFGSGTVTIALGDRCERPDDYAPAFQLAREAVELMVRLGRRGSVIAASELGPYGLLLRASSREDLEAFARRLLRPLFEHDRTAGGELLATLRAYLEEDRVQRRVAARCFIHVNTVVYRVKRIEELLGLDLGDPKVVFDVTLALRILDLLDGGGDRPAEEGRRS